MARGQHRPGRVITKLGRPKWPWRRDSRWRGFAGRWGDGAGPCWRWRMRGYGGIRIAQMGGPGGWRMGDARPVVVGVRSMAGAQLGWEREVSATGGALGVSRPGRARGAGGSAAAHTGCHHARG